ncbi:MAG: cation:dicarboxylase symporter family transporter [Parasporobacterium sp.]|nr:cation:dicarboxylase symporter family transporter [Parasporobacterium sp.]
MSLVKSKTIEVTASMEQFEEAGSFIRQRLEQNLINKEIITETMLVFEALFHNLLEQGFNEDTLVTIRTKKTFGELNITIGFEGKAFVQSSEDPALCSPEDLIINAYGDRIAYSYSAGYNNIRIVTKRNYQQVFLFSIVAIVLGIIVSIPIHYTIDIESLINVETQVTFPLIRLFSNAMLMVGAPVTFFSLLKNLTETYVVSQRYSSARRLQIKVIITSVISVVLAFAVSLFVSALFMHHEGYLEGMGGFEGAPAFSEMISELVPDSIIKPFTTLMPFPLIVVALLITYALCAAGKYFDSLKRAIDACYTLFSNLLQVVMFTLPFFSFVAVVYLLIASGPGELWLLVKLLITGIASVSAMAIFYLIRLLIGHVKVGPFVKKLIPLLRENFSIGSVINAVPYNVRYCTRNYGMDRKQTSEKLSILSQINLDGNCFLIMLLSMIFIFFLGEDYNLLNIIVIAVLVVFMSYGAPNQPGSILIGMLIITLYLKADVMMVVAIYAEVFFGALQNLINVTGNIVTIAIEDQAQKRTAQRITSKTG